MPNLVTIRIDSKELVMKDLSLSSTKPEQFWQFISSIHSYFSLTLSKVTTIFLQRWDHGIKKTMQCKRKLFLTVVPKYDFLNLLINTSAENYTEKRLGCIKAKGQVKIYNFHNSKEFIMPGEMSIYCSKHKIFFANSSLDSFIETYSSFPWNFSRDII